MALNVIREEPPGNRVGVLTQQRAEAMIANETAEVKTARASGRT